MYSNPALYQILALHRKDDMPLSDAKQLLSFDVSRELGRSEEKK